jgi:hypothetical protein
LTGDETNSTELQLPSADGEQMAMERKRGAGSMALEAIPGEYGEKDARPSAF